MASVQAVMLRLLAEALRTPVLLAAVCALHLAMVAAVVTSAFPVALVLTVKLAKCLLVQRLALVFNLDPPSKSKGLMVTKVAVLISVLARVALATVVACAFPLGLVQVPPVALCLSVRLMVLLVAGNSA